MELLAPLRNLQKPGVLAVEERFPDLHGWSGAMHLNGGLPREGLLFLSPVVGGVLQPDSIGLLITDKPNIREELWALLFDEFDEPYSAEQRIINIEAYSGLNLYELIGKAGVGYVLYAIDTPQATLNKALRYFKQYIFINYTNHENYINQENYA